VETNLLLPVVGIDKLQIFMSRKRQVFSAREADRILPPRWGTPPKPEIQRLRRPERGVLPRPVGAVARWGYLTVQCGYGGMGIEGRCQTSSKPLKRLVPLR
jgi:hypothetical protein